MSKKKAKKRSLKQVAVTVENLLAAIQDLREVIAEAEALETSEYVNDGIRAALENNGIPFLKAKLVEPDVLDVGFDFEYKGPKLVLGKGDTYRVEVK